MLDAVLSLTASEAGVEEVTEDAVATVSYFRRFLNRKWGLTFSIFTKNPKIDHRDHFLDFKFADTHCIFEWFG